MSEDLVGEVAPAQRFDEGKLRELIGDLLKESGPAAKK